MGRASWPGHTSQITPVTPDRAIVYTAITFRFGVFNPIARLCLPGYTRIVINQDVRIMANQTANLRRYGGRRFNGTEADVIHRGIESLRDHALAGGQGPAPEPIPRASRSGCDDAVRITSHGVLRTGRRSQRASRRRQQRDERYSPTWPWTPILRCPFVARPP